MKVHLLTGIAEVDQGEPTSTVKWLRESAAQDPFRVHELVATPEEADAILFARSHPGGDPYLVGTWRHPYNRRFAGKCFLYHDADYALPLMRGIYPSILKRDYQHDRCRSFGYVARLASNPFVVYRPEAARETKWLYTFFGENNCAVRARILAQEHSLGRVFDSTGKRHWSIEQGPERDAFMRAYAEAIAESAFVLCPRGLGPSTYRLFETMEMGRAPVILSDDWVPPPGPDWERFCVILREDQAGRVAEILSQHEPRHEEMGRLAREAWEQYFSQPVTFHRLAELCAELRATPLRPFSQARATSKLLAPEALVRQLRPTVRRWLK